MIRINWEEVPLIVLFSAMMGAMLTQEKYWAAAACAAWVGFMLFAASRRPQETAHD